MPPARQHNTAQQDIAFVNSKTIADDHDFREDVIVIDSALTLLVVTSGLDSSDRQLSAVGPEAVQLNRVAIARGLGKPSVDRIHCQVVLLSTLGEVEIDALLVRISATLDADLVIASCICRQGRVAADRDPAIEEHFFRLFELAYDVGADAFEIVEFVLEFAVLCLGKFSPRGVRNGDEAHGGLPGPVRSECAYASAAL